MDVVAVASLVLTVLSLLLAVYTLQQARSVQEETRRQRNRFLFQQRGPDFIRRLSETAERVNLQVTEARLRTHELRTELMTCAAHLQSFEPKLEGEKNPLRRSKDLRRQIENALQEDVVSREALQDIHDKLQGLTTTLQDLLEDRILEV